MQTLGKQKVVKSRKQTYTCNFCHYSTSRKLDYEKHILTDKHQKLTSAYNCKPKCACGQIFNHRQSLYRHKKTCMYQEIATAKVAKVANLLISAPKQPICDCGASFTRISNLKRHQKVCKFINDNLCKSDTEISSTKVAEMFGSLKQDNEILNSKLEQTCEDNKLLKEKITQLESGVMTAVAEPKTVNKYNNIVFLLNEKCSDAIAISDFAK